MSLGQLGSLVVSLEANMASFQSDMGRAAKVAEDFQHKIEDVAKVASGALAAIGVVASVDAFAGMVEHAMHAQAGLKQLAEQTNSTVESLSGLKSVAKLSETDMESVGSAINKMSKNMAEGGAASTAAFKAIGISSKEMADGMKDPAAMMLTVAKHLDGFKDSASKTAVEMAIFGKAGAQLGPLLKDLADQGELAARVTTAQAIAADDLEKNLIRLKASSHALYNEIAAYLTPKMNDIVEGMVSVRKESGLLEAAYYGLGGAIVALFGGETNELKRTEAEIKDLFATLQQQMLQLKGREKNGTGIGFIDTWLWGDQGDVEKTKAKLNDLLALQKKLLGEAADKNKAATESKPDAAYTGPSAADTSKFDAAIKKSQDFINQLGKQDAAVGTSVYQQKIYEAEQIASMMKVAGVGESVTLKFLQQAEQKANKLQQDLTRQKELEDAEKRKADAIDAVITKLNNEAIAEADSIVSTQAFAKSLSDANDMRQLEIDLMGASATDRATIIDQTKLENDFLKQKADIIAHVKDVEQQELLIAQARASTDEAKASVAQYQKAAQAQTQFLDVWKSVDQTAHDTFVNIFQGGKDAFTRLTDTLKSTLLDLLYQMTVKKWVFNIAASVTSNESMAGAALGVSGGGGYGGLLSNASNAYSLYSAATVPGGAALGAGLYSAGSAVGSAGMMGYGAGVEAASLGAVGEGASVVGATGAVGSEAFAAGAAGASSGITAALAAVPVWGWVALGAAALLGMSSKGGPKDNGEWATSIGAGGSLEALDKQPGSGISMAYKSDAMAQLVDTTAGALSATVAALGGSASGVKMGMYYNTDPRGTAPDNIAGRVTDANGNLVYSHAYDASRGSYQTELQTEAKRVLLAGIGASDVAPIFKAIVKGVGDIGQASSTLLDTTMAQIQDAYTLVSFTNANPVADAMKQIDLAASGATGALQRNSDALMAQIAAYDGSAASTKSLATATQNQYAMELNLIGQIQSALASTHDMFNTSADNIKMSVMDNPQKYDYLRSQADDLYQQLAKATDPAQIQNLASKINSDINSAYGMLDATQQKGASSGFVDYLGKVDQLTSERLKASQDDVQKKHEELAAAMTKKLDETAQKLNDAAAALSNAAAAQATAKPPIQVSVSAPSGSEVAVFGG